MKLQKVHAREVFDSRGNPTVEAELWLADGGYGSAMVPSGASTGSLEAFELRDGGERLFGKGVKKAVNHVNGIISDALVGENFSDFSAFDAALIALDITENKKTLGANAILAVSLAAAHAVANQQKQPLWQFINQTFATQPPVMPVPFFNILNGGAHAANQLDVQEFMVVPVGASNMAEALEWGVGIYHQLKAILAQEKYSTNVGDEGGFAPDLSSNQQGLDLVMAAIEATGLKPGTDVQLALDIAANELYTQSQYHLQSENKYLSTTEWVDCLINWVENYPICSIEDGMAESDWHGWRLMTEALGHKVQLVGDDLFVTNTKLLSRGLREKVANAILIKPNQIGSLTETVSAIQNAQDAGYGVIISHRSGETEDTSIADLCVGMGAGQIKTGAPARSDRTAKYNQLLRISETPNLALHHWQLPNVRVTV